MIPLELFRQHASECEIMAANCCDKESKLIWKRLADRWHHFAETEGQKIPPKRRKPKYRVARPDLGPGPT